MAVPTAGIGINKLRVYTILSAKGIGINKLRAYVILQTATTSTAVTWFQFIS